MLIYSKCRNNRLIARAQSSLSYYLIAWKVALIVLYHFKMVARISVVDTTRFVWMKLAIALVALRVIPSMNADASFKVCCSLNFKYDDDLLSNSPLNVCLFICWKILVQTWNVATMLTVWMEFVSALLALQGTQSMNVSGILLVRMFQVRRSSLICLTTPPPQPLTHFACYFYTCFIVLV